MPRISTLNLTKLTIDGLPNGKDAVYFDRRLAGFGVRTKPNGRKTYLLQYVNREGRERRHSIGQHGALSPDQAREIAQKLLGRIADGWDPAQERVIERQAESVVDLWRLYSDAVELGISDPKRAVIRGRGGTPKKASSHKADQSMFKRHIGPLLAHRKIKDLKRKDISVFMNEVSIGKTAIVEKTRPRGKARVTGGAGIATRALGLLGSMMTYAISIGIIEVSPCAGIRRTPTKRRKVRLSPDQYVALGDALRKSEDEGEPWQAIEAIWAIALTGCRKSEVTKLKPEEVDASASALRLIETKTGESLRPLGAAAIKVLRPRLGSHKYVFYSMRNEHSFYTGLPAVWQRVMTRVDPSVKMPHLTLHGLRHAFASQASDLGLGIPTIKELLGHAPDSDVTAGYIHCLDTLLVAAADKVAGAIYNYLTGAATSLSAKSLSEDAITDADSAIWQSTSGGQLVSIQEAAVMLGVGRPTVERLIEAGELPAVVLGRQRRVEVTEVLAYRRSNSLAKRPILATKLATNGAATLLSAEEAAMVLRVGRPTVMKLIAIGQLKAIRVGARFKLPVADVMALRETHFGCRGNVDISVALA